MRPQPLCPRLFFSYVNEDAPHLERLEHHLDRAVKQGEFSIWSRSKLSPGTDVAVDEQERGRADVVVALVSAQYLADSERRRDIEIASEEGRFLVPVLLRSCAWEKDEILGPLTPVPRDEKDNPFFLIAKGKDTPDDTALTTTAKELMKLVVELRKANPGRWPDPQPPVSLGSPGSQPRNGSPAAPRWSPRQLLPWIAVSGFAILSVVFGVLYFQKPDSPPPPEDPTPTTTSSLTTTPPTTISSLPTTSSFTPPPLSPRCCGGLDCGPDELDRSNKWTKDLEKAGMRWNDCFGSTRNKYNAGLCSERLERDRWFYLRLHSAALGAEKKPQNPPAPGPSAAPTSVASIDASPQTTGAVSVGASPQTTAAASVGASPQTAGTASVGASPQTTGKPPAGASTGEPDQVCIRLTGTAEWTCIDTHPPPGVASPRLRVRVVDLVFGGAGLDVQLKKNGLVVRHRDAWVTDSLNKLILCIGLSVGVETGNVVIHLDDR